jgi:hypothetical protein
MAGKWIRCFGRGHVWHNGWDEEKHVAVWTCKRCGKERRDEGTLGTYGGTSGGLGGAADAAGAGGMN